MASANTLPIGIDRALRTGFFQFNDPGASNDLTFHGKGFATCLVDTAGAESRALPAATGFGIGTELTVIFRTDGGDLSITGAVGGTVTLTTAGSFARFLVTTAGDTRQWVVLA